MHNIVRAAQDCGYLQNLPPLVDEREVGHLPRNEVMLLATGSQGEARSALARVARGEHPHVVLEKDDTVIFSSRVIPGNEKAIFELQNNLVLRGVEVMTEADHFVHVSGHPCREELLQMYQWVRPQIAVPMHGEPRHLLAHARLAESCQVPQTVVPSDGTLIRLTPGKPQIVDHVPVGRLALDGANLVPSEGGAVRERRKLSFNGAAVLTLVVDPDGKLADDPQLALFGLLGDDEAADDTVEEAIDAVEAAVERLKLNDRRRDAIVHETARLALRRFLQRETGRKPATEVHLVRLD